MIDTEIGADRAPAPVVALESALVSARYLRSLILRPAFRGIATQCNKRVDLCPMTRRWSVAMSL